LLRAFSEGSGDDMRTPEQARALVVVVRCLEFAKRFGNDYV